MLFVVLLVSVVSCGGGSSEESAATTLLAPTSSSTVRTSSTSTTETGATTTSFSNASTTSLPGRLIDFGPRSGDVLGVVGVAYDDFLNLRSGPGSNQPVLALIEPMHMNLVAEGETWDTAEAFWIRVDYEDTSGWVHFGFVAYLGYTDDATATVVADLGQYPVADTMEQLGMVVSEVFESLDPPSRVVMSVEPSLGDLGEVTYDVIGLGDDAEHGVRLHVFGEPTPNGFALTAVELTSLCGRGVTDHGLCI